MILTATASLADIAAEVARSLVLVSGGREVARLSTPLLYPGGSMIGVELSRGRDGFLVTDAGSARREAGLMGGERAFARLAPTVAQRFGVRFDRNMIFDLDVREADLVVAVAAVANAAKTAVETTAEHLAASVHPDHRAMLLERLEHLFGSRSLLPERRFRGASEEWEFDAALAVEGHLTLFDVVSPHANSVSSATMKFLDVKDLGDAAPKRVAVLTSIKDTPRLKVLHRVAQTVELTAADEILARAA